jgi:predicted amidophosphoribosyltransferase
VNIQGAWHLVDYIPYRPNIDEYDQTPYTDRLNGFKHQKSDQIIDKWCQWSFDALSTLEIEFDYIVRALGSKELKPEGNKSLDTLGIFLESKLSAKYVPELLNKVRVTRPMHLLYTKAEREENIVNSYSIDNSNGLDLDNKKILILDDIVTTSLTIGEIVRALREEWENAEIYVFSLGSTNYDKAGNKGIQVSYFD